MTLPFSLPMLYRFNLKFGLNMWKCGLHTLIHTLPLESPLPNIVVAPKMSDINIPAIDVKFWMSQKTYHTHIISELSQKFTSWQEILSSRHYHCTTVFCDYILGDNIEFRDTILVTHW